MSAKVLKTHCESDVASLRLENHSEHCVTMRFGDLSAMHRGLCETAQECDATILSQFVFAGTDHYAVFKASEKPADWPLLWLQGDACDRGEVYSMQAVAISGLNLQPIHFKGREMGFTYEDDCAEYCRLRGVIPQDVSASRAEQTRSAFETMDAALKLNGFQFTDTVRTWIYLDQLLDWYDEFNEVRTQYFEQSGIFDCMVPASTGIGASNPFGAAIMMDVLAVKPKGDALTVCEIPSPLQNPALDYKSSFSRAVELAYPTHKSVLISGTASIDPDGATVFPDDPEKQIRLTLEVVAAILASRDLQWSDLFRGIAYLKNMDYLPIYQRVSAELGIPPFPLAISHADVCRDDLLFEIEVDAVKAL